jgi:hypothetical protein
MKDIISILLTTSCLAIAGLGIYFFSYNSQENDDIRQKAGKKKNISSNKKQTEIEDICKDDYDDYDDYDNSNNNNNKQTGNYTDDYNDKDTITDYKYITKGKPKNNNNKTKKYTNKPASSKKRYY